MADLTQVAANVAYVSGPYDGSHLAGEALTAGDNLYLKLSDLKWYQADADAAGKQQMTGFSLSTVAINTPASVALPGAIVVTGATMTQALPYCLSKNPGKSCPVGDLASGMTTVIAFVATSTTQAQIIASVSSGVTP